MASKKKPSSLSKLKMPKDMPATMPKGTPMKPSAMKRMMQKGK